MADTICPRCSGSGKCQACGGTGENASGYPCSVCSSNRKCLYCDGKGIY